MGVYAIHFDSSNGNILSLSSAQYASPSDLIVNALPTGYSNDAFRVKLDSDSGDPLEYLINRATGYAYDVNGSRASNQDETPDEEDDDSGSSGSSIEPRGINLNGGGSASVVVVTTTTDETSGDTSSNTSSVNLDTDPDSEGSIYTEDDIREMNNFADSSLNKISLGNAVLCNLVLSRDAWAFVANPEQWDCPARSEVSSRYIQTVENEAITQSTVLNLLGCTRQNVVDHIYWTCSPGKITFETAIIPRGDIEAYCYLMETGDEWSAYGVIEAWPINGVVSKRFRQSLNATEWSQPLAANSADSDGADSVTIATSVTFGTAKLLAAIPEWTGNNHVIIPQIYIDTANENRLCYTLTNTAPYEVTVTEVSLRLLYIGTVSGLVESEEDDAEVVPYITDVDIDLLT